VKARTLCTSLLYSLLSNDNQQCAQEVITVWSIAGQHTTIPLYIIHVKAQPSSRLRYVKGIEQLWSRPRTSLAESAVQAELQWH
jgi:hypothetical protein